MEHTDETKITIPAEYHITPQSIEYLKYHIESEVKSRLLRLIGLPVGVGGVMAIVLGLLWFLPSKVEQFILTSPAVEAQVHDATEAYLSSEAASSGVIRQSVTNYFADEPGRTELAEKVSLYLEANPEALGIFFDSPEGQAVVAAAASSALGGSEFKSLFQDAVDEALSPVISQLPEQIRRNTDRTVIAAGGTVEVGDRVEKGMYFELEESIAAFGQGGGDPVLMELVVGSDITYSAGACRLYTDRLSDELGTGFVGTLVRTPDQRMIALLRPDAFAELNDDNRALIDAINALEQDAIGAIAEAISPTSTVSISDNSSLADALMDPVWLSANGNPENAKVAVTGDDGRLIGFTTRRLLLGAATDQFASR